MQDIFHSILPIFLVAFIGSIIRRKWLTSDSFWRGIEKLSFYILFPAVLFNEIKNVHFISKENTTLAIALTISTSIIAIGMIIHHKYNNYCNKMFTSTFQGATRYNNYTLFALSFALFGNDGVAIVSALSAYMITFTNVISTIIFILYIEQNNSNNKRHNPLFMMFKSIFANPLIIASVVGFYFNYWELSLSQGLENTITTFANAAFAIGLMIVGASLRFTIEGSNIKYVLFTSAVKLIAMPIITYIILWIMSVEGTARSIGVLFSCLPCASSAYIISRQMDGDTETMSSIITFTTILSILTLSIFVFLLGI